MILDLKITRCTPMTTIRGGGQRCVANVCEGMVSATITTRYEAIGPTNIISLAHYPMSVVMYEFD